MNARVEPAPCSCLVLRARSPFVYSVHWQGIYKGKLSVSIKLYLGSRPHSARDVVCVCMTVCAHLVCDKLLPGFPLCTRGFVGEG